jgi:Flp pilus assembly protein CpaB
MANTALPGSPARALRPSRRIDVRALAGFVLFLLAVGGSIVFWTLSTDTRSVLVLTRELPAGAILQPTDLTVSRVRVDDTIFQAAVPANALNTLIGRPLAEPAHAGQLLTRAQVSDRPPLAPGQLALTIPAGPATAVGGSIQAGDAVQVLLTTDKGKPEARTVVVLPRATVYDVGYDERLTVVNTSGAAEAGGRAAAPGPLSSLTLLVDQEQAVQLAQARWAGELDVALLPPGQ